MKSKQLAKRVFQAIGIARELNGYVLSASRPDEKGYFRSPVIQLDTEWRGGVPGQYDTDSLLDAIENPIKSFNIALRSGNCYGEYYHPIYSGQPLGAWVKRCMTIDGSCESHFISHIEPGPDINDKPVLVMVHKPSGPYAEQLDGSLRDPDKNTSYSIRCLVNKRRTQSGKLHVDVVKTFDHCDCPGFEVAGTRYQPHIHRVASNNMGPIDGHDLDVSMVMADLMRDHESDRVRLHSDIINDLKLILDDDAMRMPDMVQFIDKVNKKAVFTDGTEKSAFECFFIGGGHD